MKYYSLLLVLLAASSMSEAQMFRGMFDRMGKAFDRLNEQMNLRRSLSDAMPDLGDLLSNMGNASDIMECYADELNGQRFNIFNGSMPLDSLSEFYYSNFNEKRPTAQSMQRLMQSMRDIITTCVRRENNGTRMGFTELSDMSDEQIMAMTGLIGGDDLPTNETNSERFERAASGRDSVCIPDDSYPQSMDWRERNAVTPVKNQGQCGSCWSFASTASIESAYLIKGKASSPSDIDLSEQQLVDCAKRNGCQGGYALMAMEYVQKNGQTAESNVPYRARDNRCPGSKPQAAEIKNFCIRSRQRYGGGLRSERLSDEDIAKVVGNIGPVYGTMYASSNAVRNYRGGVINDRRCSTRINHAITIVGYTPDAWIIKNSWGERWGENGYFRLARGSNMCGINTEIAYPILD